MIITTARKELINYECPYVIAISIIIPAYNEEATVVELLSRVRAQKLDGIAFEVIVINDCSTDGTRALLEANPDLYTKVIHQPRNGGKGAAVKAGLEVASGDFILFQDADLEYDPAEYRRLTYPLTNLSADIVMGSRMTGADYTRVSYFWHKVGNFVITFLFNVLNNTTFTDVYSCYLIYRRSLLRPEALTTEGWEQHAEILSRVIDKATAIYEVPINYHGRTYAEGKKIRAHHVVSVIWTIFYRRFAR